MFSTSQQSHQQDGSSSSSVRRKNCAICNAPARSYNFGVVTCEACKSFFRRTYEKKLQNTYRCVNGHNCVIDIDGRKSCCYCRLQRCLQAGMDISKAKSTQEKSAELAKRRSNKPIARQETGDSLQDAAQSLHRELIGLTNWHMPTMEDKGKFFSMIELFDLDALWGKYSHSFYNIPIKDIFESDPYSCAADSFSIISAIGQRLYLFSTSLPQFMELCENDRKTIFRDGCSELCMINSALTFNIERGMWLAPTNRFTKFYKNVPPIDTGALLRVLGRDLHEEKVKLTLEILRFQPDEMIVMLLFTILLFSPGRPGIIQVDKVREGQRHFALLLKKYLHWRFGSAQGRDVFYGLTSTLKNFRRIGRRIFEKIHGPIFRHPSNSYMGIV